MAEDKQDKQDFLRRWSRLKKEAAVEKPAETPKPSLPSVDNLTPESDYTGFMHPKVEDALRRVALKKLFRGDPHFNLPDPYEAYSGDWTVGEPIPPEMLATLNQAQQLLFGDKKDEEKKQDLAEESKPAEPNEPGKQDA
jgi:hypothetical protein